MHDGNNGEDDGGASLCNSTRDGFDTSQRHACGDDVADATEECDGTDLRGSSCAGVAPDTNFGTLICATNCTFDTAGYSSCSDGALAGEEACDTEDFGAETCVTHAPRRPDRNEGIPILQRTRHRQHHLRLLSHWQPAPREPLQHAG